MKTNEFQELVVQNKNEYFSRVKLEHLGSSHLGLPLWVVRLEGQIPKKRGVLVLGGVHGNEPEGVIAAYKLIEVLASKNSFRFDIAILACLNPEGFFQGSRLNSRGVDLNRNLATKDWSPEAFSPKYPPGNFAQSEVENQLLVRLLEDFQPGLIISLHSFENFMMNVNGDCRKIAEAMQKKNRYPIEESIGYPTPGCLGTYAGLERDMPTITYEIKRGSSLEEIVEVHVPSLMAGLEFYEMKEG